MRVRCGSGLRSVARKTSTGEVAGKSSVAPEGPSTEEVEPAVKPTVAPEGSSTGEVEAAGESLATLAAGAAVSSLAMVVIGMYGSWDRSWLSTITMIVGLVRAYGFSRGLTLNFVEGERIRVQIDSIIYEGKVKRKENWLHNTVLEGYNGNIFSIPTKSIVDKVIEKLGDIWMWEHSLDCDGMDKDQICALRSHLCTVLEVHPSVLGIKIHMEPASAVLTKTMIMFICKIQAQDVNVFMKVKEDLWIQIALLIDRITHKDHQDSGDGRK